jgi:hypothetical protein
MYADLRQGEGENPRMFVQIDQLDQQSYFRD